MKKPQTTRRDTAWVKGWLPQGGTAKKQPKLPEGHVGRGPNTERYTIRNCRWPGTHPAFPDLPPPEQVRMLLGAKDFKEFYRILDFIPYVFPPENEAARRALKAGAELLPADKGAMLLMDALEGTVFSRDDALDAMNRAAELGWKIAHGRSGGTRLDAGLKAFELIFDKVRLSAHATLHLWVSGLDPDNPHVRGTASYFHELAVDPMFWMLHTELDRWWFTWQEAHDDPPPLAGKDAVFQPLRSVGGPTYELDWLTDRGGLPYVYDALYV